MSVGQSAVSRLQSAMDQLDVSGAGVLWIDEPAVGGATVIGRVVGRHIRGANEVSAWHGCPQCGFSGSSERSPNQTPTKSVRLCCLPRIFVLARGSACYCTRVDHVRFVPKADIAWS